MLQFLATVQCRQQVPFRRRAVTSSRSIARNTLLNIVGQVIPMFAALIAIPILIQHLETL